MDNKLLKSWILLLVLIQVNCVFSKGKPGVRKLPIPPEIVECNSIAEVRPYLSHKRELMRMWAVRRLGQLGAPNAVSLLVETFAKEPYVAGIDSRPYAKMEIIKALGKIGGDEAKASLLSIFNTYWERGPRTKRYVQDDSDYSGVVPTALEALYAWRSDNDIFDMFKNIYLEERKTPDSYTRETAYRLYLSAKMEREGIVGKEKQIKYLLSNLTSEGHDWIKGRGGVKTLQAIKDGAIITKLEKYGEPALPYIETELAKVSPTEQKRRYKGLTYVKMMINSRLERKLIEQNEELKKTLNWLDMAWHKGELKEFMTQDKYLEFRKSIIESYK